MPTQRTGNPTVRNGLMFGAILGMLGAANELIQWLTGADSALVHNVNGVTSVTVNDTGSSALLGCVVFLALLGLTFIAGMITARSIGIVGSGALIGSVVGLVVAVAALAPGLEAPAGSTHAQVVALLVVSAVVGAIFGLVVDAGVGAGMGALGGLIGANGYRQSLPPTPPAYYPGYPGTPAQPGMAPPPWPSASTPQPPPYPGAPTSPQQ
jgi:hypothetical protein